MPAWIKIRGYVTAVISPTSFEVEDYRITRDEKIDLEFENQSPEIQFRLEDIRVGTEIEIQGDYDEETGELQARKLKIDLEQFKKLEHTAILSRPPEGLQKTEAGWIGTFFADGRRIQVTPATQVLFRLNKAEKKQAGREAKKGKPEENADEESQSFDFQPLQSLDEVGPGVVMTYEGKVDRDGLIQAERVEFMRNELEKGEGNLWKSIKVNEKAPDFQQFKAGELQIHRAGKYKLLPSREVQEYVRRIGQSLIPAYQNRLPEGDPLKIPFRFYVVVDKSPNAFALPNGIIVVNSGMIDMLENEAQLAAVVGHEIAHATQEHTWRQMRYHRKKRMALGIGRLAAAAFGAYGLADLLGLIEVAIRNGYNRSLENQADRVGLEYMVAAGYDPREATRVWKLMALNFGDRPTDFFWSSHDNHTTRRSYLMLEIRNSHSGLDYSALKKNEEDYRRIRDLAGEAAAKKKKIKVKG